MHDVIKLSDATLYDKVHIFMINRELEYRSHFRFLSGYAFKDLVKFQCRVGLMFFLLYNNFDAYLVIYFLLLVFCTVWLQEFLVDNLPMQAWGTGKIHFRHNMLKPTKWPVQPAKTEYPGWSVFTVRMKKCWVLSYPLSAQRRLIRLGGCPGWSESLLAAQSFCWFCLAVVIFTGSWQLAIL